MSEINKKAKEFFSSIEEDFKKGSGELSRKFLDFMNEIKEESKDNSSYRESLLKETESNRDKIAQDYIKRIDQAIPERVRDGYANFSLIIEIEGIRTRVKKHYDNKGLITFVYENGKLKISWDIKEDN